MSKMFETLGPLGLVWCFSKIEDSEKLIYEFRERERERERDQKQKVPSKNHYEPTMEPLSSLSESTIVLKEKKQREIYICKGVIFNFVIVGLNSVLFRYQI